MTKGDRRFAHEVNWYQTDGTYQGGVDDFQAGWKAVSDAMDQIAPSVKMFFTPNVASDEEYDKYYPQAGRVDVIGIGTLLSKTARICAYLPVAQTTTQASPVPSSAK